MAASCPSWPPRFRMNSGTPGSWDFQEVLPSTILCFGSTEKHVVNSVQMTAGCLNVHCSPMPGLVSSSGCAFKQCSWEQLPLPPSQCLFWLPGSACFGELALLWWMGQLRSSLLPLLAACDRSGAFCSCLFLPILPGKYPFRKMGSTSQITAMAATAAAASAIRK